MPGNLWIRDAPRETIDEDEPGERTAADNAEAVEHRYEGIVDTQVHEIDVRPEGVDEHIRL